MASGDVQRVPGRPSPHPPPAAVLSKMALGAFGGSHICLINQIKISTLEVSLVHYVNCITHSQLQLLLLLFCPLVVLVVLLPISCLLSYVEAVVVIAAPTCVCYYHYLRWLCVSKVVANFSYPGWRASRPPPHSPPPRPPLCSCRQECSSPQSHHEQCDHCHRRHRQGPS